MTVGRAGIGRRRTPNSFPSKTRKRLRVKGKKRTNRRLRHYSRLRTRRTGTKMRSRPKTSRRRRLRTQKTVRQRPPRKGPYVARGGRSVSAATVAGFRHARGQDVGPAFTSDSDANSSTVLPSFVNAHSGADIVGALGSVIRPQASLHSSEVQKQKQGYFTSVTKPAIELGSANIGGAGLVMAGPTIKNLVKKGVGALKGLNSKATSTEAGPDDVMPEADAAPNITPLAGSVDPVGDPDAIPIVE